MSVVKRYKSSYDLGWELQYLIDELFFTDGKVGSERMLRLRKLRNEVGNYDKDRVLRSIDAPPTAAGASAEVDPLDEFDAINAIIVDEYSDSLALRMHALRETFHKALASPTQTGEERACPCGLATCVESWEPGCDLGTREEFARRVTEGDDTVRVPRELTAENGVKAVLMEEFRRQAGRGRVFDSDWTTIKAIYKVAIKHFAESGE